MPQEVFGTIPTGSSRDQADVLAHTYLALPLSQALPRFDHITVHQLPPRRTPALSELVRSARGEVYLSAEGLDEDDLNLEEIDDLYRRAGLRRYRQVYAAELSGCPGLAGALIAFRGPLGFNFSFLENRADLITATNLSREQAAAVSLALVAAGRSVYADFEPGYVPVVAADIEASALITAGAIILRRYCQAISLRTGYPAIYDHFRRSYDQRVRQGEKCDG
jgi:hypothetical protein